MAALATKKETTVLLACPVCERDIEATVTFEVTTGAIVTGSGNDTVSLNVSSKPTGLTVRHSCLPRVTADADEATKVDPDFPTEQTGTVEDVTAARLKEHGHPDL